VEIEPVITVAQDNAPAHSDRRVNNCVVYKLLDLTWHMPQKEKEAKRVS